MVLKNPDYSRLYERIGYIFKNPDFLDLALTHCSYQSPHNERLEFLGDAVLGCSIANILYERFPECSEGELTRMRAFLVKGPTLCALAEELNFAEFLKLGIGELKTGGRKRESILENSLEALIGAVFLDSDFKIIRSVIAAWYESRLAALSLGQDLNTGLNSPKDAKSRLQEYLQKLGCDLPSYEVINIQGKDHEQIFTVNCRVIVNLKLESQKESFEIQGIGSTRKSAEQEAANLMYQKLVGSHS